MKNLKKEEIKQYEDVHLTEDIINKLYHLYQLVHEGHYMSEDEVDGSVDTAYKISQLLFDKKL